jgi:hypothetical protein
VRPLSLLRNPELDASFRRALAEANGTLGAHCIHELWMRGEFAANIEAALAALWQHASASIPEWLPMRYVEWLPLAYEVALGFHEEPRGRYNVYMVLLDFRDRRRGPYGVYVGMTQYSPAERFDQHKAGIHAAGSVLKRGLEVLAGPTLHLQRMARGAALRTEAQLADALRDAGLLVEGGH